MKFRIMTPGVFAALFLLTACTVTPIFSEAKKSLTPIANNQARIFVYQKINLVSAFFPTRFNLDGQDISTVFSGTSFLHDTAAGAHKIIYNDGKSALDIDLAAGQAIYVKYSRGSRADTGSFTIVEIIPMETAETDMANTNFVEAKIRTLFDQQPSGS